MARFRTPNKCQNGHFRWLYWEAMAGVIMNSRWGRANCKCPTHEIGEGFAPIGSDQQCTEVKDRNGNVIYVGDILQRYPESKYPYAWEVKFSTDEGFGFPDNISVDVEIVSNNYEGQ